MPDDRMRLKHKPAELCTKCRGNAQLFLAAGELLLLKSVSVDPCCFLPLYSRKAVIARPPFYCIKSSQVAITMKSLLGHLTAPLETSAGPGGNQALVPGCGTHSQPRLPPFAMWIFTFVVCCLGFRVGGSTPWRLASLPSMPK